MSGLDLAVLGSPTMRRAGEPVEVDTRKAVALLTYLAVTARPHGRDFLAGLLWPDADTDRARAALRRTLSALNTAVGEGRLEADRRTIRLVPGSVDMDVDRFRGLLRRVAAHHHGQEPACASCTRLLEEAITLYGGDFLAGFALRDADAFDEWQFFQAEELRRELSGALERLVGLLTAQGRFEEAAHHGRRWLALDPLHEPAHQRLMALYASAGQRGAALRQYRECARILDRELGVPPLEETTKLHHSIEAGSFEPLAAAHATLAARPPEGAPAERLRTGTVPLVGRDHDLEVMASAYQAVQDDGHLLVLEGEAGIGKTRLAVALAERARARGGQVVSVRCYEGEAELAYAPVAAALRALLERVGVERTAPALRPELARLVPALGTPPAPPLDQPGARTRFLEALTEILSLRDGGGTGLLAFDDLQWADEASLDVLAYLVRRLPGRPVCVLFTWRPGEGGARAERLRRILAEARRGQAATLVSPQRLELADVRALVSAMHLDVDADEGARQVLANTGGLPLFVVEYLGALASGELRDLDRELPLAVRDLLRARISAVGGAAAQALAAAAVIGRSFDAELLRDVSGRGDEETVTALESLVSRGVAEEVAAAPGSYDLAHPRLRELVYEETSLARRRLLHRRAAAALTARHRREPTAHAAVIAQHHRLAGEDDEAAARYADAARHARLLGAHAEALEHLRAALALGHPEITAIHRTMGDLQVALGAYGAALTSFETAAATADGDALPEIEHRLGLLHQRRGDWALADAHLQAALDGLGDRGKPSLRSRVCADRGLGAHRRGADAQAGALARDALALAEEAGDGSAIAQAENLLGILAASSGDLQAARAHLEAGLRTAEQRGHLPEQVAALNNLALAHARAGSPGEAVALAITALERCRLLGDRHRQAALHNNLADFLHAEGRAAEAMEHLKAAVQIFAEVGEPGVLEPEIWKLVDW